MVLGIVAFNCYRQEYHFKDKFEEPRVYIYLSKALPGKNRGDTSRESISSFGGVFIINKCYNQVSSSSTICVLGFSSQLLHIYCILDFILRLHLYLENYIVFICCNAKSLGHFILAL